MMRFYVVLAIVLTLGYCAAYPVVHTTKQVRFRIDVAIETPDGVKSGHGVWGYRSKAFFHDGIILLDGEWRWRRLIDGQAIAVPLGDGRVIYALLGGRMMPGRFSPEASFGTSFMNNFPATQLSQADGRYVHYSEGRWSREKAEVALVEERKGGIIQLDCVPEHHGNPMSDCPAFALVAQRDGPAEATLLDINDLSDTLGPGYRLQHVKLTVTDAPVTHDPAALPLWAQAEPRERIAIGGWRDNREEMLKTGFVRLD
ncbi:hypothetical protein [Sphingomonas sp.]|uniref:hypothetical protein n=1 Tax=Sphingomonas sp. TaxID=28214 RepID=UPI002DD6A2EF|nr:hypothetical protein [Sphingomonas sp.]